MWTTRPEKKEGEAVLQAQKQILPYSPWKRPQWSSFLRPVEEMAMKQIFPCKAWRGTHRSRYPHCTSTVFFLVFLPEEGINGDYGRKEVTLRCLLGCTTIITNSENTTDIAEWDAHKWFVFWLNTFIWNTIIHAKLFQKNWCRMAIQRVFYLNESMYFQVKVFVRQVEIHKSVLSFS